MRQGHRCQLISSTGVSHHRERGIGKEYMSRSVGMPIERVDPQRPGAPPP